MQLSKGTLLTEQQASSEPVEGKPLRDEGIAALVGLGNALAEAIVSSFQAAKELDAAFAAFEAARRTA